MKRNVLYLMVILISFVTELSGHNGDLVSTVREEAPAASTLLQNLVSYYTLDEASGMAIDAHGNNDGTASSATPGNAGILRNAYGFAGWHNVNVNNILPDVATATKGTFSVWVRPTSETATRVILSFGDANANESIRLFQHNGGKLGVALTDRGSNRWRIETNAAVLSKGAWAHISVVQDGTPVLYINGAAPAQSYKVSRDLDDWFSACTEIDNARIGTLNAYNSGESLGWRGAIDEVGIWNRALSENEIAALYNGGNGLAYPFSSSDRPTTPGPADGVQVEKPLGGGSDAPNGFLQFLPDDYSSTTRLYPTIIFLHGSGERGNGTTDLDRVDNQGIPLKIAQGWKAQASGEKFIVLSPQQSTSFNGWIGNPRDAIPNDAIVFALWALNDSGLRIDPSRLYITGLSMGSPWNAAGFNGNIDGKPYKNIFAAIAPVSAAGEYQDGQRVGKRSIPVWSFHGTADQLIPLSEAQRPINGMSSVGANPKPMLTVYVGLGHGGPVWNTRAYATDHTYHNPNVFEWFLAHELK